MIFAKLRSALITGPLIALATTYYGSISLVASLFAKTGNTQHSIARAWAAMLLRIASVEVRVEGLEKIAPGGSYVFIANHRSYFDVVAILPQIGVQFRFLANQNLFSLPFIGYHLKRAGHIPVNSSNARESLQSMSKAAQIIQKRRVSILLFPEGGRTYSESEMDPFKDGAAYIAIKAGVPIVPIGLIGLERILPRGGSTIRGGKVTMRIGDPIETLDLSLQDRSALTQMLRNRVAELTGAPSAERVTAPTG
jgi:1-acyl-sn-glycerol-3-phosphate acyltransferase